MVVPVHGEAVEFDQGLRLLPQPGEQHERAALGRAPSRENVINGGLCQGQPVVRQHLHGLPAVIARARRVHLVRAWDTGWRDRCKAAGGSVGALLEGHVHSQRRAFARVLPLVAGAGCRGVRLCAGDPTAGIGGDDCKPVRCSARHRAGLCCRVLDDNHVRPGAVVSPDHTGDCAHRAAIGPEHHPLLEGPLRVGCLQFGHRSRNERLGLR